jgi:hypothetical protein
MEIGLQNVKVKTLSFLQTNERHVYVPHYPIDNPFSQMTPLNISVEVNPSFVILESMLKQT